MLCFGLVNGHYILGTGEGEQIRSVSRSAIYRNVSIADRDRTVNQLDTIHRLGDYTLNRNIIADTVVDTDVQGISGRDV